MTAMQLRLMVSRHSAFYAPVLSSLSAGFLASAGLDASYAILGPGRRSHVLLREGAVDVMQSAVSSNWGPLARGEAPLPLHFALINRRDGFFLAGRRPAFEWKMLEGRRLLADHGQQPLAMLKYAARHNGVDWDRIQVIDAGAPPQIEAEFRAGGADFAHLQGPTPQQIERDGAGYVVASVGESMPEVAFSSLMAMPEFLASPAGGAFSRAYCRAREWTRSAEAREVAGKLAGCFPGVEPEVLAGTIARYQSMGTWSGPHGIEEALYRQALAVFLDSGVIEREFPFSSVVLPLG